ncbi:MAG: 1,4-alpha-glucan branching enzyme, partial [Microbacterium sp.]
MTSPSISVLDAVATGSYHAPHDVLGTHRTDEGWVIRARRPMAETVTALTADGALPDTPVHVSQLDTAAVGGQRGDRLGHRAAGADDPALVRTMRP